MTSTSADDTALEIRADIPATVAVVTVRVGDPVAPGDQLVMLESMKMEIPVLAEVHGVVEGVGVGPGDTVRTGDLIVTIAPGAAVRPGP